MMYINLPLFPPFMIYSKMTFVNLIVVVVVGVLFAVFFFSCQCGVFFLFCLFLIFSCNIKLIEFQKKIDHNKILIWVSFFLLFKIPLKIDVIIFFSVINDEIIHPDRGNTFTKKQTKTKKFFRFISLFLFFCLHSFFWIFIFGCK